MPITYLLTVEDASRETLEDAMETLLEVGVRPLRKNLAVAFQPFQTTRLRGQKHGKSFSFKRESPFVNTAEGWAKK